MVGLELTQPAGLPDRLPIREKLLPSLDGPGMLNVIIDLQSVDYVDSVIISSLLRCLTKCKQRRGKSVFCNASENMTELLKCIRLGKLWPSYDSREEALAAVNA